MKDAGELQGPVEEAVATGERRSRGKLRLQCCRGVRIALDKLGRGGLQLVPRAIKSQRVRRP